MQILEIPNGGMPLHGNDLLWSQNGLIQMVEALAKPFLVDDCAILSGLEIDGNSLKPGTCIIDGKFYTQPSSISFSGSLSSISIFAHPSPQYDPAGSDVFADNVTRDTYRIAIADTYPSSANFGKSMKLDELDKYRFTAPRLVNTVVYEDGVHFVNALKYGNIVHLMGKVPVVNQANPVIFTLPNPPMFDFVLPIKLSNGLDVQVVASTSGNCFITPTLDSVQGSTTILLSYICV